MGVGNGGGGGGGRVPSESYEGRPFRFANKVAFSDYEGRLVTLPTIHPPLKIRANASVYKLFLVIDSKFNPNDVKISIARSRHRHCYRVSFGLQPVKFG